MKGKIAIKKTGGKGKIILFAVVLCLLVLLGYTYVSGIWVFEKKTPTAKPIESVEELAKEYNNYIDLKESTALKANEIMARHNEEKDDNTRLNISQEYMTHVAYMLTQLEAFDEFIVVNKAELKKNNVTTDEIREDIKRMAVALKNNLEGMQAYGEVTAQQEKEYNGLIETLDRLIE